MKLNYSEKDIVKVAVYLHFKSLTNETSYAFEELPQDFDDAIKDYQKSTGVTDDIEDVTVDEILRTGETKLKEKGLLKYLCPFLLSTSNDIQEYAKVTYTVLLPLILSETIVLSLNPLIIAAIAVVVYKGGIDSVCSEYKSKKES